MVEVFVNFARSPVFGQEVAEDTKAAHPHHLSVNREQVSIGRCSQFEPDKNFVPASQQSTDVRAGKTYVGILASAVPFLFPNPRCLPILLAAVNSLARARECIVTCLRIMRPSETSLRIVWRELALEISEVSLGSSQILRLPQPTTEAARRFCVRRLTLW